MGECLSSISGEAESILRLFSDSWFDKDHFGGEGRNQTCSWRWEVTFMSISHLPGLFERKLLVLRASCERHAAVKIILSLLDTNQRLAWSMPFTTYLCSLHFTITGFTCNKKKAKRRKLVRTEKYKWFTPSLQPYYTRCKCLAPFLQVLFDHKLDSCVSYWPASPPACGRRTLVPEEPQEESRGGGAIK